MKSEVKTNLKLTAILINQINKSKTNENPSIKPQSHVISDATNPKL